MICPARAREQAEEYGHSVRREMGYLAAHGLLHLLGYDHETEEERAEMRQKEEAALAACELTREGAGADEAPGAPCPREKKTNA